MQGGTGRSVKWGLIIARVVSNVPHVSTTFGRLCEKLRLKVYIYVLFHEVLPSDDFDYGESRVHSQWSFFSFLARTNHWQTR